MALLVLSTLSSLERRLVLIFFLENGFLIDMPFLARNRHIPLVTFGAEMTFLATTVAGHLIFMLHKAHSFAAVISDTLLRHRTWTETKLQSSLFIGLSSSELIVH